jgi:hypothetical protein
MTLALASKTWDSLARLYDVTLPSLENRAALWATSLFSQAYAAINSDFTQSLSYANGLFTRAEAVAQGWVNTALLYAADLFARAEADALALVSRAEADAANLVTQASTALQAQITSAEALAAREVSGLAASTQAAVNQLANDITSGLAGAEALAYSQVQALQRGIVTDLETIGDTAVGLAWPDAVPDINALRGVLGADFPWLNDLLGIMAGAGTAGLLGALIRSMATSQALTRLATDCIVPNCRNLSGLGNDLSQLLGIISEGALLAWLAEMVANPQGWARDTGTVLGPIGNDSISAARTLLGV